MALAPGSKLGPYEILAPLGAGGMGEVWRARDNRLGRDVAVKVLPDAVSNDSRALARFESEARAVAALSHPNILALFDIGEANGVQYAVTELLEGETLRALVSRGPLPVRRALEIAHEIAEALAAAHGKGIVHRDVKPENVFLAGNGHAKLLDFGLARHQPSSLAPERHPLSHHVGPDRARRRRGHGGLHVPRAGPRRSRRPPHRPVLPRHRPLRDADGNEAVRRAPRPPRR